MVNNLSLLLVAGGAAVLGYAFLSDKLSAQEDGTDEKFVLPKEIEGEEAVLNDFGKKVQVYGTGYPRDTVISKGWATVDAEALDCELNRANRQPIIYYDTRGCAMCRPKGKDELLYLDCPPPGDVRRTKTAELGGEVALSDNLEVVGEPIVSVFPILTNLRFRLPGDPFGF